MNKTPLPSRSAPPHPTFTQLLPHASAALLLLGSLGLASAATVTLKSSDASGTTSFTGNTNWSDNAAPSAANDYVVGSGLTMRTPSTQSQTYTFGGNSLTLAGTLAFKMSNVITVADLRLTNGTIANYNTGGNPDMARLAGNLNVQTNGTLDAGGTATSFAYYMRILAAISGDGALTVRKPGTVTFSAANSYTGPLTVQGTTLELDGTASLTPSSLTLQNFAVIGSLTNNVVTNIVRAGGSLNVGYGTGGVLRVGYRGPSSTNSSCTATLDVSSQPQFTVNVGEFSVANNQCNDSTTTSGNAFLATNNTVTATNIVIGTSGFTGNGTGTMVLGSGSNYFNTPLLTVGGLKQKGSLRLPAGGSLRLDNGANRADLTVGGETAGTSVSAVGTNDLSAGTFSASLGTLALGSKTGPSGAGSSGGATGVLLLSSNAANNVDANAIFIGRLANSSSGTPLAQGTLTVGGGSFQVNGDVTLASYDYSGYGSASGTLNINGGTFTVTGSVIDGGGTATLSVNSVLDLPAGGTVSVDTLSGSGRITNASSVAVSSSVVPGTTNTAGTLTTSSLDLSSGAALYFNLGSSLAVGAGTNDLLQVNGNLTLAYNTVTVTPLAPLAQGTYRLINYTGQLNGYLNPTPTVIPATRQNFMLDASVPGQVNLVVSGNPTSLVWSGDNAANWWDAGSSWNWNGQTSAYYDGDYVTFNDSGSSSPDLYVATPVQPGSMTVSNTAKAYTFTGMGITTTGSLIKRGSNQLTLANDGNSFSGPISIEAGTLSIGNGGTAGSLGNGAITNNGELLINRASPVSLSGPVSGTGSVRLTGGGSILNFSGTNSYTGVTTVEPGCAISVMNNSALGSTNTGTVVQSGGRVGFTSLGNWTVAEPLEINGYGVAAGLGALYANTANNNVTWAGPITVGSDSQIRIVNGNVHLTLANTVIGDQKSLLCSAQDGGSLMTFQNTLSLGTAGSLTKDGVGTVVLAGSSNLCGSVTVNSGTLLITATNAPQFIGVTVNTNTLQIGDGGANGALPTGPINLAGSNTTLVINSALNCALNTPLTGLGALSKLNYGTLTITSSNSFSGNVTTGSGTPTAGGTINLRNSYGLGDGTASKTVKLIRAELQLQDGLDIPAAISFQTSGGSFITDVGAGLIPLHSLSGDNTIEGSITLIAGANSTEIAVDSGTLTLNGPVTPNTTGRNLYLSGAGAGALNGAFTDNNVTNIPGLVKQGTGTWTLNNANTYSGATTVQGGTLALGASASIPNTPSITLLSNAVLNVSALPGGLSLTAGQTLQGNGSIRGNLATAGTVSPGAPVGTLNFSNSLTLSGLTLMELNRTNAQNADLITAAALTFGGTLTVTNAGDDLQAGDSFHLFAGLVSGAFAVTNLPALSSTNLYWDLSVLNSQGTIRVASTLLPPPAAPHILPLTRSGTDLLLQFDSETGHTYVLEATPTLSPSNWAPVQTNAGGGTLTFTIPATPATPQRYFRIRAL